MRCASRASLGPRRLVPLRALRMRGAADDAPAAKPCGEARPAAAAQPAAAASAAFALRDGHSIATIVTAPSSQL